MKRKKHIRFTTKLMLTLLLIAILTAVGCLIAIDKNIHLSEMIISGGNPEEVSAAALISEQREQHLQIEKEADDSGNVEYTPYEDPEIYTGEAGDTETINNAEEAMALLISRQKELGIEDASAEYYVAGEDIFSLGKIYIFQQMYNGITVKDSQLRMTVDNNNKILSISGNYCDVSAVDVEKHISYEDAYAVVEAYLREEYSYDDTVDSYMFHGGAIVLGENGYFLGYIYSYMEHTIILDAAAGTIYTDYEDIQDFMTEVEAAGQDGNQTISVNETSLGHYKMEDTDRNIIVYDGTGHDVRTSNSTVYPDSKVIDSNSVSEIEWDETDHNSSPSPSAVDAMKNVAVVYDFYETLFHIKGPSPDISERNPIRVVTGVSKKNGSTVSNNAVMSGDNLMMYYVCPPENEYSSSDVITGHEYTHGVERGRWAVFDFSKTPIPPGKTTYQTTIQYGIGEAASDIFGLLIGDYGNDGILDNDYGWKLPYNIRDLEDPKKSKESGPHYTDYQQFLSDGGMKNVFKTAEDGGINCHESSTLLSHPAYLMSKGINGTSSKKISNEKLANLWYDALSGRSGYASDFLNVRYVVEEMAAFHRENGSLTDSQVECVLDAFDRVGLGYSVDQESGQILNKQTKRYEYALNTTSVIKVYDLNNELYNDYTIKAYKKYNLLNAVVSAKVTDEEYTLKLPAGLYTIVISDNNPKSDLSYSYTAIVNDNDSSDKVDDYSSNGVFYTEFKKECRQVALVLDGSGSMDGRPMEETIKSAQNFVDMVMQQSAHTKISVFSYANGVDSLIISSSNEEKIKKAIGNIRSGGGTNMHGGMSAGYEALRSKKADIKLMFVLSDGLPNTGEKFNGNYSEAVKALARSIKNEGIIIYSLGFFHNCSDSERAEGTALMNSIASENNSYTITKAEEVAFTFKDIADRASLGKTVVIKLECPIDVKVVHGGEELNSSKANLNTRTDFGSLIINEEEESKTLYLDPANEYEIIITGYDEGTMDYSISFPENGEYTDTRHFNQVPISKGSVITTFTAADKEAGSDENQIIMNIDHDGDGIFDSNLLAAPDGEGLELEKNLLLDYVKYALASILGLYLLLEMIYAIRIGMDSRYCSNCGAKVGRKQYCIQCGQENDNKGFFKSILQYYRKQSKAWLLCKMTVIMLSFLIIGEGYVLMNSGAYYSYKELCKGHPQTAEIIYEHAADDNFVEEIEMKLLTAGINKYLYAGLEDGKFDLKLIEYYENYWKNIQHLSGSSDS